MKIYRRKYKTLVVTLTLLILIGSTFSCKKDLDNEIKNDTYGNTFWKSQGDVNGAVAGAYGLFRKSLNQNSCFFIWGDAPAGLFYSDEGTLATDVNNGSFTVPYWNEGAHNWTNWYRVIDASNLVIENVNRMSDDLFTDGAKKAYLGEAYFLRALSYFYMTRVWGDLPLQLTATTSADQAKLIGRTEAATILKQVISDAQKASSLLTFESATANQRRRASKGAALALLAHASAWGNDYPKTVIYADSIINKQDLFRLQPTGTIRNVFKDATAAENIFVITAKDAENESSAYTNYIFTANVAFLTVSSEQKPNMPYVKGYYFSPKARIDTLYKDIKEDTRRKEFFYDSNVGTNKEKLSFKKYSDIAYKNTATNSDPRAESNLIIFRLADMILLKAEALNALGKDADALNSANLIRARAGVSDLTGAGFVLRKKILQERQRELIGEGQNYFDLVRVSVNTNDRNIFSQLSLWSMDQNRFNQKGYLWPIANSILNSNRLINQNLWWMGKI